MNKIKGAGVFTPDGTEYLNTVQAAEYINERLPDGEKWTNPVATLNWHRLTPEHGGRGDIPFYNPPEMGSEKRKVILFDPREIDKWLAGRKSKHSLPAKLEPYAHHFGELSDNMIAKMAGCSGNTVKRHRERLGIPSWDNDKGKK